jgi:DNA-binding IclR family transcriptional regulator
VPKHVPAVQRAIQILRLLGRHPDQALTLSEVVEETGINLSTCHSIVVDLTNAGFLLRHERKKTYTLGPALLEFAALAARQYPALSLIRDGISKLSLQFDATVVVGSRERDEIIVVAHHDASWGAAVTPTGFRMPLAPPMGLLFLAWADDRERDAWLANAGPEASSAELEQYRRALREVRERGHWVTLLGTLHARVLELGAAMADADDADHRRLILTELASEVAAGRYGQGRTPTEARGHDAVGVPVFEPDGRVRYTITAIGRPEQFAGSALDRITEQLRDLADEAAAAIAAGLVDAGCTPARRDRRSSGARRRLRDDRDVEHGFVGGDLAPEKADRAIDLVEADGVRVH